MEDREERTTHKIYFESTTLLHSDTKTSGTNMSKNLSLWFFEEELRQFCTAVNSMFISTEAYSKIFFEEPRLIKTSSW